jgi:hypothetical protein
VNSFSFVTSKLGDVAPATRSIAKEVYDAARAAGHEVWFMWGMGGGNEHGSGRALDFMVRNEAAGDYVRDYLWTHRERLRLRHAIWEQHITSTVVQPGVRRKMEDRGNVTDNHYDHVHAWFNEGSYRSLSAPTTTPRPTPVTPSKPASRPATTARTLYWNKKDQLQGADVRALQRGLKRVFPLYANRLDVDGYFGPRTDKAVREFQRRSRLKVDGRVGPKTREKLRKSGIRL